MHSDIIILYKQHGRSSDIQLQASTIKLILPRPHFEGVFLGGEGGGRFFYLYSIPLLLLFLLFCLFGSVTITSPEALWIALIKAFKKIKEKVKLSWWPFSLKQWLLGRAYATDVCWQGYVKPVLIRSLIPVRQICVRRSPQSRCNFSGYAICTCLAGTSKKWA